MKRRIDVIDQFADLVVGADDARRLAGRSLDVLLSLTSGRSAAVFSCEEGRLTLFASRGIDQHVLDGVDGVWSRLAASLRDGEAVYVAERKSEVRLPKPAEPGGPASLVVAPVHADERLVGLVYIDSLEPRFCTPHDLERLAKFGRIFAKALTDVEPAEERVQGRLAAAWDSYLERTPVDDIEREKLLLLLNRNEWNIARVARLMGVTRRTIYLRLARYNVPRERVRKTRGRAALRPATS